MIELIATAESLEQADALLDAGIDTLYVGQDEFGLRLPSSFSLKELKALTELAHRKNKRICVAVNALMHNDRIEKVPSFLTSLKCMGVDAITVGDPGVIHLLKKHNIGLPYIYDAQTLVTSARQVNFWAKRGTAGAVLAREITFAELKEIAEQVTVPVEVLVYGATCIHHSKRPLVENYFNFTGEDNPKEKALFISEPKKPESHYSIYEDINGTHVFATNDVNLFPYLKQLADHGLTQWKLDGIFTPGADFAAIANLFAEAKEAIIQGSWTSESMEKWNKQLISLHPKERELDTGFFLKDPQDVQ
jgi:collagenase-like PrtC family protease